MPISDTIHGDVKPKNILVEESEDGLEVVLTDFGSSSYTQDEVESLQLTRSQPWEAPEWSSAKIDISAAKQTDIYSFGLVCLWLFFGAEKLDKWGLGPCTIHDALSGRLKAAVDEVQYQKRTGNSLLQLAEEFVEQNKNYTLKLRNQLLRVFRISLRNEPEYRTTQMKDFIEILCNDSNTL